MAGEGRAVTLVVSDAAAEQATAAGSLDLIDPEGAPLARLTPTGSWAAGEGRVGLVGPVSPLGHNDFGPFRRLYLSPAAVHAARPPGSLLAVTVRRVLTDR